jgi:hypothetical protein
MSKIKETDLPAAKTCRRISAREKSGLGYSLEPTSGDPKYINGFISRVTPESPLAYIGNVSRMMSGRG